MRKPLVPPLGWRIWCYASPMAGRPRTRLKRGEVLRKCTAHSRRTGKPCRMFAVPGAKVCRFHGGRALQVRAAAKRRVKAIAEQYADRDFVIAQLGMLGSVTLRGCYRDDGRVKPMSAWPDEVWEVIDEIHALRVTYDAAGRRQVKLVKLRRASARARVRALLILGQHLGLFDRKSDRDRQPKFNIVQALHEGRERAARGEILVPHSTEDLVRALEQEAGLEPGSLRSESEALGSERTRPQPEGRWAT